MMMNELISGMDYDANGACNPVNQQQMHSVSPDRPGEGVGMFHGHGQQGYMPDHNGGQNAWSQHDQNAWSHANLHEYHQQQQQQQQQQHHQQQQQQQHHHQQQHPMYQQHPAMQSMDPNSHMGQGMHQAMYPPHSMAQHQMSMDQMNPGSMGMQYGPGPPVQHRQMPMPIKSESQDQDPYHFQEEEALPDRGNTQLTDYKPKPELPPVEAPKKRGRKKKVKSEPVNGFGEECGEMFPSPAIRSVPPVAKERKKWDRFNGMSVEEVKLRTLPDHLAPNLDIVIVGINPGLFAAYKGHHYAGPGNHFWKCMHLSGLIPEPFTADDDYRLVEYGIGFTNMVARPTKGSQDLSRKEIKEGGSSLVDKVKKYRPKIVVFNGKGIYEVFSGRKDFVFGKQPEPVSGTSSIAWVMPSSSARCAQLPRAADKVPYFIALRKLRDYLNGVIGELDETEVVFPDVKGIDNVKLELKDDDGEALMDLSGNPRDGVVIKEEPGLDQPVKKKRGRPRKIRPEDGSDPPPSRRAPRPPPPVVTNEDGTVTVKKRRGRPPKAKPGQEAKASSNNVGNVQSNGGSGNSMQMWNGGTPSSGSDACMYSSPGGYSGTVYQGTPPNPAGDNAYASTSSGSPARDMCSPAMTGSVPMPSTRTPGNGPMDDDRTTSVSATEESHGLDSPPPPSPSLGPADFSPPATLQERIKADPDPVVKQEDEDSGLRRSSSSAEDTVPVLPTMDESSIKTERSNSSSMSAHNTPTPTPDASQMNMNNMYGNFMPRIVKEETPQDMSSKSLSGLVSLVDQIPSIAHMRDSPGAGQVSADMSASFNSDMVAANAYPAPQPHSVGGNFSVSALTHSSTPATPTSSVPSDPSPFLHRPYATESPHYPSVTSAYSMARPMPMGGVMGMGAAPPGYPHQAHHAGAMGVPVSAPGGAPMGFSSAPAGYSYGQYSSAPSPYTHPSTFHYTTPGSLHVPGAQYPYSSPFPVNPPYQSGYPQNPMGFGSF